MVDLKMPIELQRGENQEKQHEGEHLNLDNLPSDLVEKGYGIIRENIAKFQAPSSLVTLVHPNLRVRDNKS